MRDVKLKVFDEPLPSIPKDEEKVPNPADDALMLYHLGHLVFGGVWANLFSHVGVTIACAKAARFCSLGASD